MPSKLDKADSFPYVYVMPPMQHLLLSRGLRCPSAAHGTALCTAIGTAIGTVALVFVLLLGCTGNGFAAGKKKGSRPAHPARATVLVVQSYSKAYPWSRQLNQGLEEALKGSGASVKTFYMDAKAHGDEASLTQKAKEALAVIEREKPLVVVTCDDAAQEYLAVPYLKGRDAPQVIFCGVNAPLKKYGYPMANISGVHERLYVRDSLGLLKKLDAGIETATLLTDGSETSAYVVEDMRDDLRRKGAFPMRIKSVSVAKTFQEWKLAVQRNQTRTDALLVALYHTLVDEQTGQVVPADEVMAWTSANNKLPTAGLVDFSANHGLLCGVLESGHEQGYLAGGMVRQILAGTPAGQLPVRLNKRGVVSLNLKTAKDLNLAIPYPLIESAGIVIK